ncbi:MAG: TRAP transporter large permease [Caldisericia bacterium]|nr:TRAP transporter large permease [Caldisericia bacterium]
MEPLLIMILSFLGIVILMFVGVPIVYSLGIITTLIYILKGYPLLQIPHMMTVGIESFVLLAIPLFILVGRLMNLCNLTDKLFDFADKCVGHFRGGLAQVNILASLFFAGMSGSAVADIQGLGLIEIKAMTDKGYDKDLSAAVTAASSTIGPIIPPSVPFVVYAVIAEVSVAKLFLAGIIPGILMTLGMMILVYFMTKDSNIISNKPTIKQFFISFINAIPALVIPVFLVFAILLGVATTTEIGIIAIIYIIIFFGLIKKSLSWKNFLEAIRETIYDTAKILIIISVASFYGKLLTMEQIPQALGVYVSNSIANPMLFLLLTNLLLLLLGSFLDTTATMLLILPILLPTVKLLGIDTVHFGVVVVFNLMIGLLTPPFGLGLYCVSNISNIPISRVSKKLIPFYIPLILTLIIITYCPHIVLFLTKYV